MNGIEKTLRDTLAKLENPDARTRQKLYDTTESILRRSLEPFMQSRPELATERLQGLKDIIILIEHEYSLEVPVVDTPQEASFSIQNVAPSVVQANKVEELPVVEPVRPINTVAATTSPQVHVDPVISDAKVHWPDANVQPPVREQSAPHISVEKERALPTEQVSSDKITPLAPDELKVQPSADPKPTTDKKADLKLHSKQKREKRRRRGSLLETIASSIVSVILIVFLLGGIWLFSNSEYYQLFLDWRNDGKIVNSEEQISDKDFIPKPLTSEGEQSGNWVEIFGYQDVNNVRGRGEVLVETIGDRGEGGVRITSVNSSEFGEAQVLLDANKLQSLTSRKFAIALSVFVEQPTQIYIKCLLKNGVETDRRRFQLNGGLNNVMLEMDMTSVTSFDPTPHIAVNSDITGGGRPIELYDVRYQIIE